jgi:MFS transporter, DHA3 family, macrolide efflux protein
MFCMFFPVALVNASFMSMMQSKVPPDLQGRVFAALGQMSILLMPISALLVGPLADQVVEPLVNQPGWEGIAPLVGNTPGSGIGLIFFAAGMTAVIATMFIYSIPKIRLIESILPDYKEKNETLPEPDMEAEGEVVFVA